MSEEKVSGGEPFNPKLTSVAVMATPPEDVDSMDGASAAFDAAKQHEKTPITNQRRPSNILETGQE